MNVLYLSVSYVPSRSASSLQSMKMCGALAGLGHQVELVSKECPARQEPGVEDPYSFYGVRHGFRLTALPRPRIRGGGIVYARGVASLLAQRSSRAVRPAVDLVYSRDLLGATSAVRRGLPCVFEAHGLPQGRFARRLANRLLRSPHLRCVVAISDGLRRDWLDHYPHSKQVEVVPDAADPRPQLPSLPREAPNPLTLGYVGSLYTGRGVDLAIALAESMPDVRLRIIGDLVDRAQQRPAEGIEGTGTKVEWVGYIPPSQLDVEYAQLDVLLMPHQRRVSTRTGRSDIARWTSPLKLFDYMSTGRPIVASDLQVLREVLRNESNALLVDPESVEAWKEAVERLQHDWPFARALGTQARRELESRWTWDRRAAEVLRAATLPGAPQATGP